MEYGTLIASAICYIVALGTAKLIYNQYLKIRNHETKKVQQRKK